MANGSSRASCRASSLRRRSPPGRVEAIDGLPVALETRSIALPDTTKSLPGTGDAGATLLRVLERNRDEPAPRAGPVEPGFARALGDGFQRCRRPP